MGLIKDLLGMLGDKRDITFQHNGKDVKFMLAREGYAFCIGSRESRCVRYFDDDWTNSQLMMLLDLMTSELVNGYRFTYGNEYIILGGIDFDEIHLIGNQLRKCVYRDIYNFTSVDEYVERVKKAIHQMVGEGSCVIIDGIIDWGRFRQLMVVSDCKSARK
jgi:hypothetical protein